MMNDGKYIAIRNYLEELASLGKKILAEQKRTNELLERAPLVVYTSGGWTPEQPVDPAMQAKFDEAMKYHEFEERIRLGNLSKPTEADAAKIAAFQAAVLADTPEEVDAIMPAPAASKPGWVELPVDADGYVIGKAVPDETGQQVFTPKVTLTPKAGAKRGK